VTITPISQLLVLFGNMQWTMVNNGQFLAMSHIQQLLIILLKSTA